MHEVLRAETRGTGVRATLVSPSSTDTPIWDSVSRRRSNRFSAARAMLAAQSPWPRRWCGPRRAPADVNVDELRLSAT